MYVNKCTKCGKEFETKNPKRVICPNCLYPEKKDSTDTASEQTGEKQQFYSSSSYDTNAVTSQQNYSRGYTEGYNNYKTTNGYSSRGNYSSQGYERKSYSNYQNNTRGQGSYQNRSFNNNYDRNRYQQNGYSQNRFNNRPRYDNQTNYRDGANKDYANRGEGQQGYSRPNNYDRYQRNPYQQNRFNNRRPSFNNRRPKRPAKPLLVTKEQLEQIEILYKQMLPLPNPDAHEVIGEKIGLEPRKVFFGINLIRQKLMLPKLPYPKRKLAISPEQMIAIQNLYEPLLPLPPIGCHKFLAAQLKMDEWRVHVGIGLIRAKLGLERWNSDRPDAPEEFKHKEEIQEATDSKETTTTKKKTSKAQKTSEDTEEKTTKPKTTRKKKVEAETEAKAETDTENTEKTEAPKKRTTRKKKED